MGLQTSGTLIKNPIVEFRSHAESPGVLGGCGGGIRFAGVAAKVVEATGADESTVGNVEVFGAPLAGVLLDHGHYLRPPSPVSQLSPGPSNPQIQGTKQAHIPSHHS